MIILKNIAKVFKKDRKEIHALMDINLAIRKGEFVSIIGPSGSGKSTLLLTMAGLITPTAGEVLIEGNSLGGLSQAQRAALRAQKFGFVFQLFHLIPYLNILENVQAPFLARSSAKQAAPAAQAQRMLERLGLGDRLNHKPEELSVGERQRVALARALVNSPPIILADEPTGNIDQQNAGDVMKYLQEFNREGMTIILVTHDPGIGALTPRRIFLKRGMVENEERNEM